MYVEQTFVEPSEARARPVLVEEHCEEPPGLQTSLFATGVPSLDAELAAVRRIALDDTSWVDHLPRWLAGSDEVFARLVRDLPWRQRTVPMYDRLLPEPRLTWWWAEGDASRVLPVLQHARVALSRPEMGAAL